MDGYNGCVFAYGQVRGVPVPVQVSRASSHCVRCRPLYQLQTGAGKTHTMLGPHGMSLLAVEPRSVLVSL